MSHPLLARLDDPAPEARREACEAIPADPSAVLLLGPLAARLADSDPGVRRAASDALARLGATRAEVDPLLREALRGEPRAARFEAARALATLAPPAPRLVPALVEALGDPRGEVAWEAARLLVDTGRLHAEVAAIVTGLVKAGESAAVRRMAIFCLRELAPERRETSDALLAASRDAEPDVRRAALTALPALLSAGDAAAAVRERLEEAARSDPDRAVRVLAERARTLSDPTESARTKGTVPAPDELGET